MRVGVGDRSFAIVRVPFGWHQAPGLVQHLIATVIAHVDPGGVVVVQYLDDILMVGKQKQEVHKVTHNVTSALSTAGFLIGAKSILTPVAEVTWTGKTVNAHAGRIQTSCCGRLRGQVETLGGDPADTSVPQEALGPSGMAGATRQHSGRIPEWRTSPAALWAALGAQGATKPCQGHFGGSVLRAAWMDACLHPTHVHTCILPVCECRTSMGRHLGPGRPLD